MPVLSFTTQWSFLSPSGTSARKTKALQRAKARREELRTQHREMTAQEGAPSGLNLQAMALVGAGITLLSAQAVWWFWLQSQVPRGRVHHLLCRSQTR